MCLNGPTVIVCLHCDLVSLSKETVSQGQGGIGIVLIKVNERIHACLGWPFKPVRGPKVCLKNLSMSTAPVTSFPRTYGIWNSIEIQFQYDREATLQKYGTIGHCSGLALPFI